MHRPVLLLPALALFAGLATAAAVPPRLATIPIPGDPRFVAVARDVLLLEAQYQPVFAAQSGLVDDGIGVPSFAPAHVAAMTRRLQDDLASLRALPWRQWSVDEQIDVRWVYANALTLERQLQVERVYLHRPAEWLEPVANGLIAILTYAPARTDAIAGVVARIPAMVDEMRAVCRPTGVDAQVAQGIIDGIAGALAAAPGAGNAAALAALAAYRRELEAIPDRQSFAVVGAVNYAWRLRHASLLPWDPPALLALAQDRLEQVDLQVATLAPHVPPEPVLTPDQQAQARKLDQAALLALYDRIQVDYRAAIDKAGFVTLPAGVGPIRSRVTPDAMVPLTGDGGSMNPPPPWIADNTGWWNVEHFDPTMAQAGRERDIRDGLLYLHTRMAPYAAHEGLPGHHLQLSLARLNPDPLRSLLMDAVQNEGWALYAEQEMWEQGGLGPSVEAHSFMLQSWRSRIRRVVYDVRMETGAWTLQQGADYRASSAPGVAALTPEILRAVNWPTQLICYFAGKEQILALKRDYKAKLGAAYSERRFHDELLALGSVPYVFARARMLGEPVPDF